MTRCPWATSAPDYLAYHDDEWGRPVTTDAGLYERLTLEAFQSGLSWLTILRKREAFREVFAGFDADVVAAYDEGDVERLMAEPRVVRNRMKIQAAITNAQATIAIDSRPQTTPPITIMGIRTGRGHGRPGPRPSDG